MKVCEENHDSIVYDIKECPLCEALEENSDKEEEIERLEGLVKDIPDNVPELTSLADKNRFDELMKQF